MVLSPEQQQELQFRLVALADAEGELQRLESRVVELQSELKEAKDGILSATRRQRKISADIKDLESGQALFPFSQYDDDEEPDRDTETPAMNALAQIIFDARDERKKADLSALVEFGLTDSQMGMLSDELGVETVGQLCDVVKGGDWKCRGFGPAKKKVVEEAIRKYLLGYKGDGASAGDGGQQVMQVKKCLECGDTRSANEGVCACGDTSYELVDSTEVSEEDFVEVTEAEEVKLDCGLTVHITAGQDHDAWFSAFWFDGADETASKQPVKSGKAHESLFESMRYAKRMASNCMIGLGMEEASGEMRRHIAEVVEAEANA